MIGSLTIVAGLLTPVLAGVVFAVVVARYAFDVGSVALQEVGSWLLAAIVCLGGALALAADRHVRVDVLYERFSPLTRRWIDRLAAGLVIAPVSAVLGWLSWPFVHRAFITGERSAESGGLPALWLLKGMFPAGCTLLVLVALLLVFRRQSQSAS